MRDILLAIAIGLASSGVLVLGGYYIGQYSYDKSYAAAQIDRCAQTEAACMAVAERMNVSVTIPPWQAMVLTPILDPR